MPISDFTSELFELEDVIINNMQTTNTEIHVSESKQYDLFFINESFVVLHIKQIRMRSYIN